MQARHVYQVEGGDETQHQAGQCDPDEGGGGIQHYAGQGDQDKSGDRTQCQGDQDECVGGTQDQASKIEADVSIKVLNLYD
jgi:hypothetical protein